MPTISCSSYLARGQRFAVISVTLIQFLPVPRAAFRGDPCHAYTVPTWAADSVSQWSLSRLYSSYLCRGQRFAVIPVTLIIHFLPERRTAFRGDPCHAYTVPTWPADSVSRWSLSRLYSSYLARGQRFAVIPVTPIQFLPVPRAAFRGDPCHAYTVPTW